MQQDYDNAIKYSEKSYKAYEEIGSERGIATSLGNLGNAYYERKKITKRLLNITRRL